jgi:hypothetical protein
MPARTAARDEVDCRERRRRCQGTIGEKESGTRRTAHGNSIHKFIRSKIKEFKKTAEISASI